MTKATKEDEQPRVPSVSAGEWKRERKPHRRRFPHGEGGKTALRVVCTRGAYADLALHVKESLNAEVCGVLVGEVCEDEQGPWVDIQASLRGTAASQGAAHVTFTQETWTRIHAERESKFPKLGIVGWYHSHPGFGVEFSDMDIFIHQNFFSAPSQIALVSDPIISQDAACINTPDGIRYLDRVWVDGRERTLKVPGVATDSVAGDAVTSGRIDALEARIAQLLITIDEMHERVSRFYLIVGMVAILGLVVWLGSTLWLNFQTRYDPPKALNQFSMPIRIGDKDIMVRLDVVGWDVPPELNSILLQIEHEQIAAQAAALKAKAEEHAKNLANPPSTSKHVDEGSDKPPSAPIDPANSHL